MSWYVYIIETKCGKLYTGITTDLQRRLSEHLQGKKGARFFRISAPNTILFQEPHLDRSEASKREYEIKKMTRKQKLELVCHARTEVEAFPNLSFPRQTEKWRKISDK